MKTGTARIKCQKRGLSIFPAHQNSFLSGAASAPNWNEPEKEPFFNQSFSKESFSMFFNLQILTWRPDFQRYSIVSHQALGIYFL